MAEGPGREVVLHFRDGTTRRGQLEQEFSRLD